MTKSGFLAFWLSGSLLLAGCGSEPVAATEPVEITLEQLEREFDANEVGAMTNYKGKPLLVTGHVAAVILDSDDVVSINMESIGLLPVHAGLRRESWEEAGTLKRGQQIVLVCDQLSEMMGKPVLDNCALS